MEDLIKRFLTINTCSGYGDGSGNGTGDGYGYGDGYDYGSGDGYGLKSVNKDLIYVIDSVRTIIKRVNNSGTVAKGFILQSDLTLKPCFVVKLGNIFAHGDTLREANNAAIAKLTKNLPVEERIKKFKEKFTDFNKKYPAKDFFEWHHLLTGRQSFCNDRLINIYTDLFTVVEFIDITKNSYNGDIIKRLIDKP